MSAAQAQLRAQAWAEQHGAELLADHPRARGIENVALQSTGGWSAPVARTHRC
ncbi:hypothetical protein [Lichenicoccus sp.]|uniref:hypothetical protein n=1 Tax=Lichenicoccus sp. TaxID=2781899 RepID=UPI003D0A7D8E